MRERNTDTKRWRRMTAAILAASGFGPGKKKESHPVSEGASVVTEGRPTRRPRRRAGWRAEARKVRRRLQKQSRKRNRRTQ